MIDRYKEIKDIIDNANSDIVDFAPFGEGVSDEWIQKAETRLGFKLPPSYVWWLKNYRGGMIYGYEIYSIYEKDFDTIVGGDIVHMYELHLRNGTFSKDQIVLSNFDEEEFYFDLAKRDGNGEAPIYENYSKQKVADDFIEFLKKMIKGEI